MDKGQNRNASCAEKSAKREVHACHDTVKYIRPHILHRKLPHNFVTGEHREKRRGNELKQYGKKDSDAHSNANSIFQRLPCSHRISGSDALRSNG